LGGQAGILETAAEQACIITAGKAAKVGNRVALWHHRQQREHLQPLLQEEPRPPTWSASPSAAGSTRFWPTNVAQMKVSLTQVPLPAS
jgi:hypothetical protein